jgi:flagellar protein FlaF
MTIARYASQQNATATPREIELRAFRYVNGLLSGAADVPGRVRALHKTHELWSLLIADLAQPANALPVELKGRLISLGLWAQREVAARMADTRPLSPLIALHREMIAALEAHTAPAPAAFFAAATA